MIISKRENQEENLDVENYKFKRIHNKIIKIRGIVVLKGSYN